MIHYTIGFIRRNDEILLLNREKPAWMGVWNGVGGKVEQGESPRESMIREISEETGIELTHVYFKGVVTWMVDEHRHGGMFAYYAEVSDNFEYCTPVQTDEGILDWKKIDWILNPNNQGVATNIPKYLPSMLNDQRCYEHFCNFTNGILQDVQTREISEEVEVNTHILRDHWRYSSL
jgi:8-oxo-dGTP diphosphatase